MTNRTWVLAGLLLAVISASVICAVFETPFAEASIDWFSFIAGGFLAIEGIYKMRKFRADPLSIQLCRFLRIFIGVNVFLVHLAEFIWGPHAPARTSALLGSVIDWAAFSYGIFLMIEGLTRMATSAHAHAGRLAQAGSRRPAWIDQSTRALRVIIGSCVFTIHLLQFMRG